MFVNIHEVLNVQLSICKHPKITFMDGQSAIKEPENQDEDAQQEKSDKCLRHLINA